MESKTPHFLQQAQKLVNQKQTDAALDIIYDAINTIQSDVIESIMNEFVFKGADIDMMLGILAATFPIKEHLPARTKFFNNVKAEIKRIGKWENGLLSGLEN